MLPLIYAYFCIPRRFRFIGRWMAAIFVIVVLTMVVILFIRVLQTLPQHHRNSVQDNRVSLQGLRPDTSLTVAVRKAKGAL